MGGPSTPPPSAASAIRPSIISPIARRARSLGPAASEMSVQQVEDARRLSLARVLDVWSNLEQRYNVPPEDDDIVDLATGSIIQDRGVLRGLSTRTFGGQAEPGAETDAEEDGDAEDESDDELGRWSGDPQREVDSRLQWLRDSSGPSHHDKEDLASFLRDEQRRKRLAGEPDGDLTSASTTTSATDDDDDDGDDEDLDAPLPQIVDSSAEKPGSSNETDVEDESEDELLLTDEIEPRPPSSPTPTPSPAKNRLCLETPVQLYTPPRSQSIDSPVLRHAEPSSSTKTITPSANSLSSNKSFKQMKLHSNVITEAATPTLSASHSRPIASHAKRQPLPSPSPSISAEIPFVNFNDIRRGRTPRRTPAPERTPDPFRKPEWPVPVNTPSSSRSAPMSSPLKGKGKGRDPSIFSSRDDESDVSHFSTVRTLAVSPKKRKRSPPSGSDDDLGASPTKRRPSQAPSATIMPHPPAPPWPVAGPSSFVAAAEEPQKLLAQFLNEVQRMNMFAQAMLPGFWPPPALPPPPAPEKSRTPRSRRSRSADELELEHEHDREHEPKTPQKPRSRSALRTPGSARSSVRKRVTFLLHPEDDDSDDEQRGRVKPRIRGTPAPGRPLVR